MLVLSFLMVSLYDMNEREVTNYKQSREFCDFFEL